MSYTVYENRKNNRATVHMDTCGCLRMHGGESSITPPTGEYHEDLETAEAALNRAKDTGRRTIRICGKCNPPISI